MGAGAAICTFAFELFFLVAFFLFLMFLPIVVLAFQLWWMLALRFCIPPSIGFAATADFITTGKVIADVGLDATFRVEFNLAPGDQTPDWVESLSDAKMPGGVTVFNGNPADSALTHPVLVGTDPRDTLQPQAHEPSVGDTLCKVPALP